MVTSREPGVLWDTGLSLAEQPIVGRKLAAFVVTAIISQRFLPLRWQFRVALALIGILLLYLVSVEKGSLPPGRFKPLPSFWYIAPSVGTL